MTRACPARASRSSTGSSPAARRTRSTRSAAASCTARCASRRRRRRPAGTTGICGSGASSRRSTAPTCPHTAAIAACEDTARARPGVLPDGLRRRLVADGPDRQEVAGAVRHRLRGPQGPGLPAGRGHRAARQCRLEGQGASRDLGRPDGFHERQVDRWTAFLERIKGRELPGFDEAAAWLRAHKPIDFIPGLMHGDYQFANVMYQRRRARAAGRDRRLGDGHRRRSEARPGLGRPQLAGRHQTRPRRRPRATSTCSGMPTRTRCSRTTRRSRAARSTTSTTTCVLAKWKLAVVLEQGFQRAGDDEKLQRSGRSCSI